MVRGENATFPASRGGAGLRRKRKRKRPRRHARCGLRALLVPGANGPHPAFLSSPLCPRIARSRGKNETRRGGTVSCISPVIPAPVLSRPGICCSRNFWSCVVEF
ncbi:unnamed protein product [Urochloa humidicola]